jgi:Tfp pilus assembly protein PilX
MPALLLPLPQRSAGFSLITAVVIVLMVTIVGFAAMTASRSQLFAAGNAQYQATALREAERAVATAETWLRTGTNPKNSGFTTRSTETPALYPIGFMAANNLNPLTWTWSDTNSVSLNDGTARYALEQVAIRLLPMGESQRGLIDEEGNTDCKVVNVYRISARGTGGGGASRTLQTVFSVDGC